MSSEIKKTIQLPKFHFDKNLREIPDSPEEWELFILDLNMKLEDVNNQEERLPLLEYLGMASRIVLQLDKAESHLLEALSLSREKSSNTSLIQNLIRLAHVYQWKKDFQQAQLLLDQAKQIMNAASVREGMIASYHQHLGKLYFDQGYYGRSRNEFGTALGIRLKISAPFDQVESSRVSLQTALVKSGKTLNRLEVKSNQQTADLWDGSILLKTYRISTALNGLGCEEGSYCTPFGKLRVASKIGADLPLGAIIRSRVPSCEVWSKNKENSLSASTEDLVLTRLLWLEGAEEKNMNTLKRYIYLHGTNQEKLLGTQASHGCIRFSNQDILEVFDLLSVGSEVEIS
ncbi:MAG: L,D-transpeptidase [Bdellovibrionota bacterium]